MARERNARIQRPLSIGEDVPMDDGQVISTGAPAAAQEEDLSNYVTVDGVIIK